MRSVRSLVKAMAPQFVIPLGIALYLVSRGKVMRPKKWRPIPNGEAHPEINAGEYRRLSQNGEDGIIAHIFNSIGFRDRRFVEFGFSIWESNCINLVLNNQFSGLFVDADERACDRARKVLRLLGIKGAAVDNTFLHRENLDQVILSNGVSGAIDILSIDIDGNDYWLWEALTCISPRVVVIETNASLGHSLSLTVPYDSLFARFDKHPSGFYHGASLTALARLGKNKGYRLVAQDSMGVNAFFLREDIDAPDIRTLSPEEAFFPPQRRLESGYSVPQQFDMIKELPFVEV